MDYEPRRQANDLSRTAAEHDREPWSQEEVELLLTWDQTEDELTDMAEVLGRTREACRQRFYVERKRPTHFHQVKTTTTETRTETRWSTEDDQEWPSDWYVR